MIYLEKVVTLAKDILEWVESVQHEEGSQKRLVYQLSHRAEVFYDIELPEPFDNNFNISAMRASILSARSCIHDLSSSGEIRAVLLFSTIVAGLKEIVAISDEPSAIAVDDKKVHCQQQTTDFLSLSEKTPTVHHYHLINRYANKGPVISNFADFDGDTIKGYYITMTSPIKRGPGKGRIRRITRFITVFN